MKIFLLTLALVALVAAEPARNLRKRDIGLDLKSYLPPTSGESKQGLQLPSTSYGTPFKAAPAPVAAPEPVYQQVEHHVEQEVVQQDQSYSSYVAPAAPAPAPHKVYGAPVQAPVQAYKPAPAPVQVYKPAPAPAPFQVYKPAPAPAQVYKPAPTPAQVYLPAAPVQQPSRQYVPSVAHAPAPAPQPIYQQATYSAPAPAPVKTVYQAPAPAPQVYHAPAPAPQVYSAPSVNYVAAAPQQQTSQGYHYQQVVKVQSAPAVQTYSAPAPQVYSAPAPAPQVYSAPAPAPQVYSAPAPAPQVYSAPAPAPQVYHAPAPAPQVYHAPAPAPQVYHAPAPAPQVYHAPAPAPQVYHAPAPAPQVYSAPAAAPSYSAPSSHSFGGLAAEKLIFDAPVQSIEVSQQHTSEIVPASHASHDTVTFESAKSSSSGSSYSHQQATDSNGGYVY